MVLWFSWYGGVWSKVELNDLGLFPNLNDAVRSWFYFVAMQHSSCAEPADSSSNSPEHILLSPCLLVPVHWT